MKFPKTDLALALYYIRRYCRENNFKIVEWANVIYNNKIYGNEYIPIILMNETERVIKIISCIQLVNYGYIEEKRNITFSPNINFSFIPVLLKSINSYVYSIELGVFDIFSCDVNITEEYDDYRFTKDETFFIFNNE